MVENTYSPQEVVTEHNLQKMETKQHDQTLKWIDSGISMRLFRTIDKEKTCRDWLISTFDTWCTGYGYTANTTITYTKIIKELLSVTDLIAPKLTSDQIEKYLMGRSNKHFAAIKAFLKFVYYEFKKKYTHIEFPDPKPYDIKKVQTLTPEEIQKVIEKLPYEFCFFTRTLSHCGLRISEIFRLRGESFNWDVWMNDRTKKGLVTITKTKGKTDREIPINADFMSEVWDILKNENDEVDPQEYLFNFNMKKYFRKQMTKFRKNNIGLNMEFKTDKLLEDYRHDMIWFRYITKHTRFFERLFRQTCIDVLGKPSHPHVLRASRATELLDLGLPLIFVRDFLGHQSVKTTERYVNTTTQQLLNKMEDLKI